MIRQLSHFKDYFRNYSTNTIGMFVLIWMHISWWIQIWWWNSIILREKSGQFCDIFDPSSAHTCRVISVKFKHLSPPHHDSDIINSYATSICQKVQNMTYKIIDYDRILSYKKWSIKKQNYEFLLKFGEHHHKKIFLRSKSSGP